MDKIKIISSPNNWIEENSVIQLKQISTLPGVIGAVGLPDLHPGKTPVGCAIITQKIIYPHLVGNDIGCGMSMFMTDLDQQKMKIDRLVKKVGNVKNIRDIPLPDEYNLEFKTSPLGGSLGTIGGGNHFAELQKVEQIFDEEIFTNLGFKKNKIMLLVHSGSRNYGQTILDESIKLYKAQNGLVLGSEAATKYLNEHDNAVKWAYINRELISYRVLKAFGINSNPIKLIDISHNCLEIKKNTTNKLCIHRKGAARSDMGAVIIPGSRGTLSYLVIPTNPTQLSAYSIAHGAGRKWERKMCKSRLERKYSKESIKTTKFKGKVICNDVNLLFEEAPEAYKNIDSVIQSLIDFGLIKIVATLKPVITYKT